MVQTMVRQLAGVCMYIRVQFLNLCKHINCNVNGITMKLVYGNTQMIEYSLQSNRILRDRDSCTPGMLRVTLYSNNLCNSKLKLMIAYHIQFYGQFTIL